ncbi:hypothetical protein CROQUDRAFT_133529 [Cronartium quercuum f. sp. fusiforme G11]|uniref:Uncharacterized protein n=1 Tax=Cronartium quercuum f. sp. fusiforme G11 TaxID=708437 RepID=A0A9P6NLJ2_9BASI|nr:hypothetical protein CROQUDRAFT_133529 [Cronartium quercuum f. sp. fusiforme G11]
MNLNVFLLRASVKPSGNATPTCQCLVVGQNPKNRCYLPFHAHLNHPNADCHRQALNVPISNKPPVPKPSLGLTDAHKAKQYDEMEPARTKELAHLSIEKEILACLDHPA